MGMMRNVITIILLCGYTWIWSEADNSFMSQSPYGCDNYDLACLKECRCRTYTFALHEIPNLVMRIPGTSQLQGAVVEIINKVCEYAHKICKVSLVSRSMCWDGEMAIALNDRWFDFCMTMDGPPPEKLLYSFPCHGLVPAGNPVVVARPGSNITEDMIRDPNNTFTLARFADPSFDAILDAFFDAGFFVKLQNILKITADSPLEGIEKLYDSIDACGPPTPENKPIDLLLHIPTSMPMPEGGGDYVIVTQIDFHIGTISLSARMDDQCLLAWWDQAYENFIGSEEYPAFCQRLNDEAGNRFDSCRNQSVCS